MSRKPHERDLAIGADPDRFGAAIVKCEGFSPDCSYHGRCHLQGLCFSSPAHIVAARVIEKLLPTDGRAGAHFAYLKRCAELLRQDRIL